MLTWKVSLSICRDIHRWWNATGESYLPSIAQASQHSSNTTPYIIWWARMVDFDPLWGLDWPFWGQCCSCTAIHSQVSHFHLVMCDDYGRDSCALTLDLLVSTTGFIRHCIRQTTNNQWRRNHAGDPTIWMSLRFVCNHASKSGR